MEEKNERKVPLQRYKTKRNIYTNLALGKPWFGTIWPRAITSLMKIRATKIQRFNNGWEKAYVSKELWCCVGERVGGGGVSLSAELMK